MIFNVNYFLVNITLIYLSFIQHISTFQTANNGVIYISLLNCSFVNETVNVFNVSTTLKPKETTKVIITDVKNVDIQYFITQIHSFQVNTMLSYNEQFSLDSTVNGTNVGLVQNVNNQQEYTFYVENEAELLNNTILILIIAYPKYVPIPGGCNLEFMVETAPYQRLSYTDDIVTVDAQSASLNGFTCEEFMINYRVYHMHLPESNYNPEVYFNELQKMITVENIETYGRMVYKPITNRYLRRLYSAYRGTGSVYNIVAYFGNRKAAYVPITTYSCDASNWADSCDGPRTHFSKFLCSLVLFLGLFMCFFGHNFFKTEMFLIGALLGGYVVYMGLSAIQILSYKDTLIAATVFGFVFGLAWLGIWWLCGIPVISVLVVLIMLGILIASVAFYTDLGDVNIFQNDLNYWGLFVSIILMCITVLVGFTHQGNILACSVLGAFAVVIAIDNYIGSNLKYIFINIIRRATVIGFQDTIISPPFQFKDMILTAVWLLLAGSGLAYQWTQQKGRPPFPPAPYQRVHVEQLSERTPLLVHQQYVASQPYNTGPSVVFPAQALPLL